MTPDDDDIQTPDIDIDVPDEALDIQVPDDMDDPEDLEIAMPLEDEIQTLYKILIKLAIKLIKL